MLALAAAPDPPPSLYDVLVWARLDFAAAIVAAATGLANGALLWANLAHMRRDRRDRQNGAPAAPGPPEAAPGAVPGTTGPPAGPSPQNRSQGRDP